MVANAPRVGRRHVRHPGACDVANMAAVEPRTKSTGSRWLPSNNDLQRRSQCRAPGRVANFYRGLVLGLDLTPRSSRRSARSVIRSQSTWLPPQWLTSQPPGLLPPAAEVRSLTPKETFPLNDLAWRNALGRGWSPLAYSEQAATFLNAHTDKSMKSNANDRSKTKAPHNANSPSPDV